tara:strand:- start:166 stop:1227 length:1062 start_codon:yes stop_codon:yes gene_type:complete
MATTKATLLGHRSATSFSDLTLSGDLTVSGTTTTIDTEVVVSDATVINNAGSDVGLKINSTSSGNIMQLQDNGTDVMVVKDGGNVGIGVASPLSPLHQIDPGSGSAGEIRVGGSAANFGILIDYDQASSTTATIYSNPNYDNNSAVLKLGCGVSNSDQLVLKGDGNVGIGETSPSALVHLKHGSPSLFLEDSDTSRYGNMSYGTRAWNFDNTMASGEDMDSVGPWIYFRFTDANETRQVMKINYDSVITGDFNDTSDIGLKENITEISSGLDVVNQLNPVDFDWKNPAKGRSSGFIAQEIELILPNNVSGEDYNEEDDTSMGKAINTIGIVAHLTKAIQELSAKVTALENATN